MTENDKRQHYGYRREHLRASSSDGRAAGFVRDLPAERRAEHGVGAQELAKLDPAFISVTYSAGGSGNKQATAEIAAMIQDDHDVPAVAHLTCAGASQQSISTAVADMKDRGIRNVLALRGDLPGGCNNL